MKKVRMRIDLKRWITEIGAEPHLYDGPDGVYVLVWDEGEIEDGKLTGTFKKVLVPRHLTL